MKEERIVNITKIYHHGEPGHPTWTEDANQRQKLTRIFAHFSVAQYAINTDIVPLLLCPPHSSTTHQWMVVVSSRVTNAAFSRRRDKLPAKHQSSPNCSPALSPALLLFLLMIIITNMASDRSEGWGRGLETKVNRNYYKSRVRSLFFCATGACLDTFLKGPINHPPSIHPPERFSSPGRWWLGSRECCLNKCVN